MKKINWTSNVTWGVIGVFTAFLLFALSAFLQLSSETRNRVAGYILFNWLAIITVGLILLLIVTVIRQGRDIRMLSRKLTLEEPPKFKRFEQIKAIRYGHIAYRPLLYYDENDNPQGVGITLLNRVFKEKEILGSHTKALWRDLVENLASKKYDIVATPIFETRERTKRIAFCSPMFYSDIGMYVKKNSGALGQLPASSQSFEEAVTMARRMKPTLVAIEGEISGKMALKYLANKKEDVKEWLTPETASVNSLIAAVNGEIGTDCEVVFAEVFQAEQTRPVRDGDVFNILKPKQVLYPVSFAVRKSDYILRNFINLKLLEIEENGKDGILGIILEELKKHPDCSHYTLEDIQRYFVRELDGELGITSEKGEPHEPSVPTQEIQSIMNHKRRSESSG